MTELEEMKAWGEENSFLKSENRKLKEKIESLNATNDYLQDEVTKWQHEHDKVHGKACRKAIENTELRKRNKELLQENEKLKSDLSNIECEFGFECDECEYWKREIKKHKPCLIKDEYVFDMKDYDYQVLTSTTPQLKIIKKKNKGASTFTIDGFTAIGKTFSSLAEEEDLYEDVK